MQVHADRTESRGFALGLAIFALGALVGWLVRGRPLDGREQPDEREQETVLAPHLRPSELAPAAPADHGLARLSFHLPEESARVIQAVRDRAMARGIIQQTEADTVPAELRVGDERFTCDVRIKGDWTDHIEDDRWSLRVELTDGKWDGMRRFSIQSPHTRGYLWEWLILETARREGVLAPRAQFVEVATNGNPLGVFYLEEHFSKELLESQGRREGPIVLWDESTKWSAILQQHVVPERDAGLPIPEGGRAQHTLPVAEVRAYGEKRLSSVDTLSRALNSALEKMRALQALVVAEETSASDRLRNLQALEEARGATVERLMDVERLARAHALASLFQLHHSLAWHNMRFYHDPLTDRLEPILFDNMGNVPRRGREPVVVNPGNALLEEFARCRPYYDGVFQHLGRITRPAWLDQLFADLDADWTRYEAALVADGPLPQRMTKAGMQQRLRTQRAHLRTLVLPDDPANFVAYVEAAEEQEGLVSGTLEVHAWATSAAPAVVAGFHFDNGGFVPAASALALDEEGSPGGPAAVGCTLLGGAVVLPHDGRAVRLRFALDRRLASLEDVRRIKRALRERAARDGSVRLGVEVEFGALAADESQREPLTFRRRATDWTPDGGRPPAPTLTEALARHPFLSYDVDTGELSAQPGTWDVDGDLVVPSGLALHVRAGTTLRFSAPSVLLADAPLHLQGTADAPVTLEPRPGAETWRGVCVLDAPETSRWQHAVVRDTDAVSRGGWILTGGVTFYRSPVELFDCLIEGTRAEDGTNVFGTTMELQRVTFRGCASDSFDGDFVTGAIRNCTFEDGLADGVDFSGSEVVVVDCVFRDLGDKAVSVGENSRVRVRRGSIERVSIGVASKDASHVEVHGVPITDPENYGLAVFVKKAEFGPARLEAHNVTITGAGRGDVVAQTGCALLLNAVEQPTEDLDVAALYRDGVLGR